MDMISIRSLWTVEANKEANKLLNKKTNYLNYTGNSVRNLGNESVQALYSLTKE